MTPGRSVIEAGWPRVRVGNWLARCLEHPAKSRVGRVAHRLDARLNLRYLSDRLRHEDRVVRDYIGDIGELPVDRDNRISIICRVYGIRPGYLRKLIQSIQRQSYSNWELCICLDADPDRRVQKYIRRLHQRDPERYRLSIHAVNQGICGASRSAAALARGGIVMIADPDDVLHKHALAAVARAFSHNPLVDVVYTNNDILTPWGYRIDPIYKPAWSPELLLGCDYIIHLVALRRDLMARCEGLWADEVEGAEDWHLLLQATRLARAVHHIPIVLYHWRAHADSTSTNAKRWTFDAKNRLQASHLQELDSRLCWEPGTGDDPAPIRFRSQKAPPLWVIAAHSDSHPGTAPWFPDIDSYSGEIRTRELTLTGTLEQRAEALDQAVAAMDQTDTLSKEALILFLCADADQPALHGPLDTQAAFAVLPGVACVWPFYDTWRGVYTVCETFLSARLRQSGFFTNWSGNVLTGPLHGLMLSRASWKTLGGFGAACDGTVPEPQSIHALGALLGLNALRQEMRNVAVRTVTSDWRAPVLDLGPAVPGFDPYI